jgi:N-acetylmuramate 1-kinase
MPGQSFVLAPASADASFRHYWRARLENGNTLVVMDAPPSHEDVRPWLHVQSLFHAAGVRVPGVLAKDIDHGFLLIDDLGSTTYLAELTESNADDHYRAATDALVKIQLASRAEQLPPYDRALLQRELDLFPDWYLARHVKLELAAHQQADLAAVFEKILAVNLSEPAVYVHRDYHSRNLMVGEPNPGIIDFQDAVFGPISYDLASLFKDAYLEWPEAHVLDWLARYWQHARKAGLPVRHDFGDFHRDYEWMGVQRHLKILGIFARLYHRDGKDGYLKDIPLVAKYLRAACERYRDLTPLLRLLDQIENRQAAAGYTF